MAIRQDIIKEISSRYLSASRPERTKLLDEYSLLLGVHRKSLIRRIKQGQKYSVKKKAGRRKEYSHDVAACLEYLHEQADYICTDRFKSLIPKLIKKNKQFGRWKFSVEITQKVLKISISSIKRCLAPKYNSQQKGISTTKRSKLYTLIPIVRGEPTALLPGQGQIDSVAHCGATNSGDYTFTINYTDIITTWNISHAQKNKGAIATLKSIEIMYDQLPFSITWLHPDTGSEFINWALKKWADHKEIFLCRSKPNNSNDNEFIEQKNYTTVRYYFGTMRIESDESIKLMNYLYEGSLYFYINFFLPTMKCVKKKRKRNKIIRIYDKAKTPFERLMANTNTTQETKEKLYSIYKNLDPVMLRKDIYDTIKRIKQIEAVR